MQGTTVTSFSGLLHDHKATQYTPIIKGRGFCPNPVVKYGIPFEVDSILNPKCRDTSAHESYWEEEIHRCQEGYTSGGIHLPGRYYYYLNHCKIGTVERGYHSPEFVDVDLEFYAFIQHIKTPGVNKGGIFLKGRRRGISEKIAKGIFDYGMRFNINRYKCGICAGQEVYSNAFHTKVYENNANLPPELRIHYLNEIFKETITGWEEKTSIGAIQKGNLNTMFGRTMQQNPNVFKGELMNDCYFEEAGEFKLLLKGFSASKMCFAVRDRMVGTPMIGGTGGKITSSSEEFKEMWGDSDTYNLERFSLYGDRMFIGYFVGSKNERGIIEEKVPNVRQMQKELNLEDEQILGCEDVEAARERILFRRKELLKGRNKEAYYEYFLDNPLNQNESFLKFSGNNFSPEAITEQRIFLNDRPALYKDYILDWVKDKDGQTILPRQVFMTPYDETIHVSRKYEIVQIRYGPEPIYKDLDIGGGDSYDQDRSMVSKSLGAFVVLRRRGHRSLGLNGQPASNKRIPIALYRQRPPRKEIFYETCTKISVLYNLKGNTLFDASKPLVIQYYKDLGLENMLAKRPKSLESEGSTQTHDYGVILTATQDGRGSKPQMISMLQTYVLDELDECVFPLIVEGLSEYDVLQKDSDWDEVDALGIALIRDVDMRIAPREKGLEENNERFQVAEWGYAANGNLIRKDKYNHDNVDDGIKDPFMRMLRAGAFNDFQENDG